MKRTLLTLMSSCVLLMGTCLMGGCQTSGPKSFDDAMILIDKAREIAKEQGVSWKASVISTGSPELYEKAAFGLDTGIRVEIHFQGNAQVGQR